jgi:hypothetical protein
VLLAAATADGAAVVLAGTEAELDDVLGQVAAEVNHTRDRRGRLAPDATYARLEDAQPWRAGGGGPGQCTARDYPQKASPTHSA